MAWSLSSAEGIISAEKQHSRRPLSGNRALWDVLKASMTLDLIIEENNAKGLFSGRKQDHNVIKAACIGEMWEGREQHALRNNYFHTGSGLYNNMSVHYVMFLPPFCSPTVVVINHQIFYSPLSSVLQAWDTNEYSGDHVHTPLKNKFWESRKQKKVRLIFPQTKLNTILTGVCWLVVIYLFKIPL